MESLYTQPHEEIMEEEPVEVNSELGLITDLIDVICDEYSSVKKRCMSSLLFTTLRYFNVPRLSVDQFLADVGLNTGRTCSFWVGEFMKYNYAGMLNDGRTQNGGSALYNEYPELEDEAKLFAVERCYSKAGNFRVEELAKFITEKYNEIKSPLDKVVDSGAFIRSITMCRLDLVRWGFQHGDNKQVNNLVLCIKSDFLFIVFLTHK